MGTVAQAEAGTGGAAAQVVGGGSEMSRKSEHSSAEVGRFRATVQAA